jgi:beta-galactosidase/beta-glucuronidase
LTVLDEKGAILGRSATGPVEIDAEKSATVEVSRQIRGIRAWSPEEPALYTADIRLMWEDRLLDRVSVRFGNARKMS